MNRQERRAAVKRYRKQMIQNGQTTPDISSMKEPLKQPEVVADLSGPELNEIKERRRLIEKQVEAVTDAQKVLTLLRIENQRFLQSLVTAKNLPPRDDYNLDSDAGVILRTARAVDLIPAPVAEDAPDDASDMGAPKPKGKKAAAAVAEA